MAETKRRRDTLKGKSYRERTALLNLLKEEEA